MFLAYWLRDATLSSKRYQFYGRTNSMADRVIAKFLQAHDGIRTRDLFLTKEVLYH